MGILVRELIVLYEALVTGAASPLWALPIQYADFAVWQRQWLQGEVLQKQLDYWRKCPVSSHNTDLFAAATIKRWLERFQNLMQAIAENPDAHIASLSMGTVAATAQLTVR